MAETRARSLLATFADEIDTLVDTDPIKLRDAIYAVLRRIDAECDGAERQKAQGDYRTCPVTMLRIYVADELSRFVAPSGPSEDA